jgi:hypothetical protein
VILLQDKADLFFTPQLNGCSLLVFDSPNGLAVVHYNNNNQVPDVNQTFWQKWIDRESHEAHVARTEEIQLKARAVGSHAFADSFSGIANDKYGSAVGGAHLHSYHYAPEGGTAVAFGIRQGGKWHIYVQQKIANSASTKLLYTQQ